MCNLHTILNCVIWAVFGGLPGPSAPIRVVDGRVLDGGADNDEVFSFATFWYGFVGVGIRF